MNNTELKNQLKSILDIEQKIREQDELIENTSNKISSLGIANKNICPPQPLNLKYKPERKSIFYLVVDILILIVIIFNFPLITAILTALDIGISTSMIYCVIIIIFFAIVALPWIISYTGFMRRKKILDKQYKDSIVQYNNLCAQDKHRVESELLQKTPCKCK